MDIRTLQQENNKLQKTLHIAIQEAKRNEKILKRFIDIEVQMLACAKLSELIRLLLKDFKQSFRLSAVTIFLYDKDDLVMNLIESIDQKLMRQLTIYKDIDPICSLYSNNKIRAGQIDRPLRKKVFPDNPFILSCVLLPLVNKGRLIGSLHLGAKEIGRYHEEFRYEYLERMSALLAVCIENCMIHENLAHLSSTDMLTKLFNRHSFDLEIEKALQRAERHKQHLSILFLDIDHFKQVNDKHGHPSGDLILKSFAQILRNQVRNTDFLARFGGEEFAILLPDCAPNQAMMIADNLRKKVASHTFTTTTKQPLKITTSIGISCYYPQKTPMIDKVELSHLLLETADQALYQAKHSGRNQALYQPLIIKSNAVNQA